MTETCKAIMTPGLDPVLALDVGGTKILAAVDEGDGVMRDVVRIATPTRGGPEAIILAMIDLARQLCGRHPSIVAVGVGSAGQIDCLTGRVIYANENLPGWTGMEIARRLRAAVGLPAYVDNDVNAFALGEATHGAGKGHRVVLAVTVGTGVGGALVLDGLLFRGATGVAGEIGHIPVTRQGPLCACGNRGCLETYAAGPHIAAAYARVAGADAGVALPEVVERANAGNRAARRAFWQAGTRLGLALAGLINTLNPDAVVVGGGVAQAGELLLAPLRQSLDRRLLGPARDAVVVAPAALGAEAGLIGAALLARRLVLVR